MTTRDEWDVKDPGVAETSCTCCGDVKPCIFAKDPTDEKIASRSLRLEDCIYFCGPCWQERMEQARGKSSV